MTPTVEIKSDTPTVEINPWPPRWKYVSRWQVNRIRRRII